MHVSYKHMPLHACLPCSSEEFRLELLVSLLDVDGVTEEEVALGVLEVAQLIEQLASTQFQVQDFSIQVGSIRRFGECHY